MPGNKIALALALICALAASMIVYRTVKQNEAQKAPEVPKKPVIFAKSVIPARTVITAEQLEVKNIPADAVNPDSVAKTDDLVGLIAKTEILQGEQINRNRVLPKGQVMGLSYLIPPGMRAITIAMNEVVGVAGFIKPGERVDVLGTIEPEAAKESITWTILQDVEVLAVSQEMGEPGKESIRSKSNKNQPKLGTSVTLAVTPGQAQQIALAEEKGILRLTLRPLLQEPAVKVAPVRESGLMPGTPRAPVRSAEKALPPPPKKTVEVISGGKSQMVTVN